MIGRDDDSKDTDLDEVDEASVEDTLEGDEPSSDKIPDIGGDTLVDISASAEINVEELVAKLESSDPDGVAHKREVRKRLEELREQKDSDLDSTFNFYMDEDV